jgi:hypothetical protein
LLYDASLAYATAWFFQLLVISIPDGRRRRSLEAIVAPRVDGVTTMCMQLVNEVGRIGPAGGARFPLPPAEVESSLHMINPMDATPNWDLNWLELVRHLLNQSNVARAAVRPFYPRLSEELLILLEAEEEAARIIDANHRFLQRSLDDNLDRLTKPMIRWMECTEGLRQHRRSILTPSLPIPIPEPDSKMITIPIENFPDARSSFTAQSDQ